MRAAPPSATSPQPARTVNHYPLPILRMTEKALITGITGQDGSYLTEFLLAKGYEVNKVIEK